MLFAQRLVQNWISVTYARSDSFVESGLVGTSRWLWYEQEMDSPCLRVPWESTAEVVMPAHDCWLSVTTHVDRQLHCLKCDRQAHHQHSDHDRWDRFDHQRASKMVIAVLMEIVDSEMEVESSCSAIHLLRQDCYWVCR